MLKQLQHICCVDDEEDILEIIQLCLESVGAFKITSFKNGKTAIQAMTNLMPDLILLDVMMPDIDGPTVLNLLRQDKDLASIPVIFMTARIQPKETVEYLQLGAIGVIAKPFDPMAISEQITQLWNDYQRKLSV